MVAGVRAKGPESLRTTGSGGGPWELRNRFGIRATISSLRRKNATGGHLSTSPRLVAVVFCTSKQRGARAPNAAVRARRICVLPSLEALMVARIRKRFLDSPKPSSERVAPNLPGLFARTLATIS